MKSLGITITHIKILTVVNELNKLGYYPNEYGVFKIVSGLEDEETQQFKNMVGFSTLTSYGSKKINRYILALVRYGYLEKMYLKREDRLVLSLTEKGEVVLFDYQLKHKKPFKKNKKVLKKSIFTL